MGGWDEKDAWDACCTEGVLHLLVGLLSNETREGHPPGPASPLISSHRHCRLH
jgi:hypothetical protein